MGWWSGNQKYVNRRAKRRFEEAKGLVEETGLYAEQKRDASQAFVDEGFRKRMSSEIMDSMETRNRLRDAEQKAVERVATVTSNNPMAALQAKLGFQTDDELRETYGFFASNRSDIIGSKKAQELQIESDYLQDLTMRDTEMSRLMMSYHEEADKGMGGAVLGMAGSIIGGLI